MTQRRAITVVIRPVDEACNLACTYCNAEPYGQGPKVMNYESLERIISQASQPEYHFISFCWHGGEPLLAGIDFYRKVISLQHRYFGGNFRYRTCENIIQSNGLQLRGDLFDFLVDEGFHIGLSLDGPDVSCNKYRFPINAAERLLERTLNACKRLKEKKLPLVVINVVHDMNVSRAADLYAFYKQLGVDTLSFTPRFLRGHAAPPNLLPEDYFNFLTQMVRLREEDLRNGEEAFSLGIIYHLLAHAVGESASMCFLADGCHRFINVNRQGEIFASCSDGVGVHLGSIDNPGLDKVIEGARRPLKLVQVVLGRRPTKNLIGLGPGCPKYSHGQGDVYLSSLGKVVTWYRKAYLDS